MSLGENIKNLRQEHNLSQKELAKKLNVSTGNVAEWEADESVPSIREITKLSSLFEVTTDSLLKGIETTEPENEILEKEQTETEKDIAQNLVRKKVGKKKFLISAFAIIAISVIVGIIVYRCLLPFSKNAVAISKAEASVVKIICFDHMNNEIASGSGFIAYDDRTVITNYHVMEDAYICKISTDQDKTYEVESTLCYSKDLDIAIIRLKESTGLNVLKLGNSDEILKGENVIAIGSPLGIKNTVSQGILSGRIMESNMDVLQFTAAISSGSSGGALFDDDGKVIGITYASYINGQNLNLAIPIELADELYNKRGIEQNADVIYIKEHPYVEYLHEYDSAIEVTMEDLNKHPERYDDKIVKLTAYVSSFWDIDDDGPGKWDLYFISTENDLTGDLLYDDKRTRYPEKLSAIGVYLINSVLYVDPSIQYGDKVVIYGVLEYYTSAENRGRGEDRSIDAAIMYRAPY